MATPKRQSRKGPLNIMRGSVPPELLGDIDQEIEALLEQLGPDPVAALGRIPGGIEGSQMPGFMRSKAAPPSMPNAGPRAGIPGGPAAAAGAGGLMALASKVAVPVAVAYGLSELGGSIAPYFWEPKSVREDRKVQREAMKNEALANAMLLQTQLTERQNQRLDAERLERRDDKRFREIMAQRDRENFSQQALATLAMQNEQLGMLGSGQVSRDEVRSRVDQDLARLAATTGGRTVWESLGLR